MSTKPPSPTQVKTGEVRFSYAKVFEPDSFEDGDEKKYSVALLWSKKDKEMTDKMKAGVEAAKKAKWGEKTPAKFRDPIHDGDVDKPEDEAYAGTYYVNASSKTKPGIVDRAGKKITDEEEFYSGCFGKASVNFFPYDKKGNGVGCGLNNLLKTKDGERLSGRASAEDDFADDIGGSEEDDDLI